MQSLDELREEAESFLREEAEALRDPQPSTLSERFEAHRLLGSAEATRRVDDALAAKNTAEAQKPGLRRLRRFLAEALEDALSAEARDRLASLDRHGVLHLGAEMIAVDEALRALPEAPARERRAEFERAFARFVRGNEREEARTVDAAIETARRLGRPSYLALREELDAFSLEKLVADAEALLARTEDAYRDLLGFAFRKIDPRLRPQPHGDARWHDLLHVSTFPWLRGDFPERGRVEALRRWTGELGLDALEHGRVRLEDSADAQPVLAALRVPSRLFVRSESRPGLDAYRALFDSTGSAHLLAQAPEVAPVEDRRLPHPALFSATGRLFAHALTDERWLKRYLELSRPQAREVARLAALDSLIALRFEAGLLLATRSLHSRGVSSATADEFAERLLGALLVAVPRELYLRLASPKLLAANRLRAYALEAALHRRLLERYDEEFFRNPSAGAFVAALLRRMVLSEPAEIEAELGIAEGALAAAGDRLVRVMAR